MVYTAGMSSLTGPAPGCQDEVLAYLALEINLANADCLPCFTGATGRGSEPGSHSQEASHKIRDESPFLPSFQALQRSPIKLYMLLHLTIPHSVSPSSANSYKQQPLHTGPVLTLPNHPPALHHSSSTLAMPLCSVRPSTVCLPYLL
jgi:hypothetical protein